MRPDLLEDFRMTLPKGTLLLVRRIYIRRGRKDFDSLTFSIKNGPHKGKVFFVSLDDANYMEIE